MKYLIFILLIGGIISCNDTDKTSVNTTEQKTDSTVKDPVVVPTSIQLTPEEEKDDSNFADGSITTSWENAGINDPKALKLFIKKLKQWSADNNKDSIAASISYPLLNDKTISSASVFLQKYETVFNEKVKKALNNENLSQIFRRSNGVVIGDGDIWINNVSKNNGEEYRITSINYKK
jgi:hypothetical protein